MLGVVEDLIKVWRGRAQEHLMFMRDCFGSFSIEHLKCFFYLAMLSILSITVHRFFQQLFAVYKLTETIMDFSVLSRILTSTLNIAFPIGIKVLDCLISIVSMSNKENSGP
jgi:hypothetical protein